MLENCPAPQLMHTDAEAAAYCPALHATQDTAPAAGEADPGVQPTQSMPGLLEYLPGAQTPQSEAFFAPGSLVDLPAAQGEQELLPASAAYDARGQALQPAGCEVENCPCGHGSQTVDPTLEPSPAPQQAPHPDTELFSAGHGLHGSPPPALNSFALHASQWCRQS